MKLIRSYYYLCIEWLAGVITRWLPSFALPIHGSVGISSLVGHGYLVLSIYSLTSFYYHSKKIIPCTIIDDGTLTKSDCIILQTHFPGITIIPKAQADKIIHTLLKKYPSILSFRKNERVHKFCMKVTDITLLPMYKKILYIDSDVLFFNTPTRIQKWIDTSERTYLYEPEHRAPDWGIADGWNFAGNAICHELNITLEERFNSGLLCIDKPTFPLELVNRVVTYMRTVDMDRSWLAEQYTLAAAFTHVRAKTLGNKYIHMALPDKNILNHASSYACIHFAYLAKPYFYREALKQFLQTNHFWR